MARTTRRRLLQVSGSGAIAAGTGGLAGILASGRAPAFAQGTSLHWLRWNDFVPAGDEHLRKVALPAAEKALGVKIVLESIGGNDLAPRATAAIQSKSGADIIMGFNSTCQLYAESLVDVSDVCEPIGSSQGGFYDAIKANNFDGKKWLAVPHMFGPGLNVYRKSWFDEVGVTSFPDTWDEYRAAGKKLKAKGHPIGQTLGHTFGDAPGFAYAYMWSWGGKEVEADGKTVAINSKETIESVKFMTAFWKEALDEGGLAWDDSSNNRAFLSGTISSTLNGASIYIEGRRKPAQYQTEEGKAMADDMRHAPNPRGPAGRVHFHGTQSNMLMDYSKNQTAAKDFLRWVHTPENYGAWYQVEKGFATGPTKSWENHPVWKEDPVMLPFKDTAATARATGYAGRPTQKAAEALNKYIVVDMYAKAVQGMPAEDCVKWAEGELKKVYTV
jgi:multiple sugar transport system substrate-binding protein